MVFWEDLFLPIRLLGPINQHSLGSGGFDGRLDPIEETVAVSGVSYIGWTFRVRPGGSKKISSIAKADQRRLV